MNEALLRSQYHRLAEQNKELQRSLAVAEAEHAITEINLAEARHALSVIADESSNPVGIARATKQAIEERMIVQQHRRR